MSGSNTFDNIDARRELYRRRLKQRQATSRSKLRGYLLLVFTLPFILFILSRRSGHNLSKYSANNVGSSNDVKEKIKESHSNTTVLQSSSTHTKTIQTNDTTKFANDTKDKMMNGSHSMNYTTVLQSSSTHTQTNDTTAAILSNLMIKEHFDSTQSLSGSTTDKHTQTNATNVKFIPYPHKTLGSGNAMKCNWTTIPLNETNNTYDYTQQKAFSEGVCIPQNISIHIFSSNEAIECLYSKRIIISGDSYNKQLFIGLGDVLLSKHIQNGKEILDWTKRNEVTAVTNSVLATRYKNDPAFPNVQYKCERQCYGNHATRPFNEVCAECINSYTEDDNTVAVVGAGIHLTKNETLREGRSTVEEMKKFLDQAKKVIWVSMPSYQTEKVPDKFRDSHAGLGQIYDEMLPTLAPLNPKQPFLDVFQLTDSCNAANCSYDGGHRSRFVNRFKAQLLLNTLCEYSIR